MENPRHIQMTPEEIRQRAIQKWSESGLLEGLSGNMRENIAQLYENQAVHLLNEIRESSSGIFDQVTLPIARRVFAQTLSIEDLSCDIPSPDEIKKRKMYIIEDDRVMF